MTMHRLFAVAVALALFAGSALAEKPAKKPATVKSGPQVDEELAGPFHPLNINGTKAGEKHCLYCQNGQAPVAMIFARKMTPELKKLVKKLEAACGKNDKLASFVVFCSKDTDLEGDLKKVCKAEKLKKVILSIDNPAGPKGYKVAKDADVTVVLYVKRTAKANFAFKKGELKDKDVEAIIKALPKILDK